ncbi:MAG: hypothetical protein ABFS34_01150 [Gemmatimonadota bacterium]
MSKSLRSHRIGGLLLEAASVVFAVLVALAVDEWWEDRENAQLAARALDAVAAEMEDNRRAVDDYGTSDDPDQVLEGLQAAIAVYREGDQPESVGVEWDIALLSSAAWETAQLTRSTQFMELERVIEIAQIYEFQRFFAGTQEALVAGISTVEARLETQPVAALLEIRSRYALALALRRTLSGLYACALLDFDSTAEDARDRCVPDLGDQTGTPATETVPPSVEDT